MVAHVADWYETKLDQRLAKLLEENFVKPEKAHNYAFCLCSFCHEEPLLQRTDMCHVSTCHRKCHFKQHPPLASTNELFQDRKSIPLELYLEYYLEYLLGVRTIEGGPIAGPSRLSSVQYTCFSPLRPCTPASLHMHRAPPPRPLPCCIRRKDPLHRPPRHPQRRVTCREGPQE